MIRKSILRLLLAGGLIVLGFLALSPGDNTLAAILMAIGGIWGIVELFILSALLFVYGASGLIHDIGRTQDHDPWGRW